MSLFNNTWVLSLTIGLIIFGIAYLNSEKILKSLFKKTFGVQKEILGNHG